MIKILYNIIKNINLSEIIEIFILSILIYYLIKNLKNTRAWIIIKALLVLAIIYFISYLFNFNVITFIFNNSIGVLTTALIIMFQPELRRLLEGIGKRDWSFIKYIKKKDTENFSDKTKENIITAVKDMATVKTGALIVIERNTPLNDFIDSGIKINGEISAQLLENIFEHNTPLHDGAVIIRNNIIKSATSYLPLTQNSEIDKKLGTRHRAAIGMSETTDALVIVVSEETGDISVSDHGRIYHGISTNELRTCLGNIQKTDNNKETKKNIIRKRNITYSLCSLFIGFILWFSVTNVSDPVQSKNFVIPVTITNETAITDLGKSYEIIEGKTIGIKVTAKKSILKELSISDFIAEANLTRLSYTNSVPITVTAQKNNSDIEIMIKDGGTLVLSIDDMVDKEIGVDVQKIGIEKNNDFYGNFKISLDKIKITGPKKKIKTIDKAVVEFLVSDNTDLVQKVKLKIYDKNENEIDLSDCLLSDKYVEVSAEKLNIKNIDINIYSKEYELINLQQSKRNISVAGDEETIKDIEDIKIELNTSNIENNKINYFINIKDYLPDNIYLVNENDNELEISCEIEKFILSTLNISYKDIEIKNKDNKKVKILNKNIDIEIYHSKDENINISDLFPYIDISDLESGEYNIQVQFENIKDLKINNLPIIDIVIEGENKDGK